MATGSAEEAIRRAIFTKLNSDTTLSTLLGSGDVHQRVPELAALPYVAIWESTEQPFNTLGKVGRDVRLQVDIWAETLRSDKAYDIASRVDALLDFVSGMSVSGYTLVAVELDISNTLYEPKFIHISRRYRVRVQET